MIEPSIFFAGQQSPGPRIIPTGIQQLCFLETQFHDILLTHTVVGWSVMAQMDRLGMSIHQIPLLALLGVLVLLCHVEQPERLGQSSLYLSVEVAPALQHLWGLQDYLTRLETRYS
ncbi:MAG: hypothetical protein VR65_25420 [Desulfobulbaceae bacterium BRH_c16a]|nr:MAG: hypothetical protein VR65_25420 [Desulfobulbaceae bacterium BRH_c16a]